MNLVEICPADAIEEVRGALGLAQSEPVRLSELLNQATANGYEVEETFLRLRPVRCLSGDDDRDQIIHVIHAGFDDTRTYTRHFVVLSNSDGLVVGIELQRFALMQPRKNRSRLLLRRRELHQ